MATLTIIESDGTTTAFSNLNEQAFLDRMKEDAQEYSEAHLSKRVMEWTDNAGDAIFRRGRAFYGTFTLKHGHKEQHWTRYYLTGA